MKEEAKIIFAVGQSVEPKKNESFLIGQRVGDLISRQAAIKETWKETLYTDPLNVLTDVRERLKALPSAEPEIIRCGECRNHGRAVAWCQYSPDDAFCSFAERRTDE